MAVTGKLFLRLPQPAVINLQGGVLRGCVVWMQHQDFTKPVSRVNENDKVLNYRKSKECLFINKRDCMF